MPRILCAREGSSCVTVVRTPYARVFGSRIRCLGILYYLCLLVWIGFVPRHLSISGQIFRPFETVGLWLLGASLLTVMLGFYLVYALRRALGVDCPLCYAAHAVNVALFVLLILIS